MANRITLTDTVQTALIKLSDGNPGALTVLIQLIQHADGIDPDYVMGAAGYMCMLDDMDVYGSEIWMLYKDICEMDITNVCAVLRARQLGLLSPGEITSSIRAVSECNRSELNVDSILKQIKDEFPKFGQKVVKPH